MNDRAEENKAFKQAVKDYTQEIAERKYQTDKLEGFASGWLAARGFFESQAAALTQAKREGIEAMKVAAFEESWQIGVKESELDAFEIRIEKRADKLLAEIGGGV